MVQEAADPLDIGEERFGVRGNTAPEDRALIARVVGDVDWIAARLEQARATRALVKQRQAA